MQFPRSYYYINQMEPMQDLYTYITEQSDDSIYYQLARNVWAWNFKRNKPEVIHRYVKEYGLGGPNYRRGLIKWYKAHQK